ncbi:MAG TPA: DUF1616 domain-containing protein [Candidatus Thermoplasmatota archaeon]|nr:DUF1616 domain-containing protein [Candidatus Thermoplasmatota archaeon]
MRHVETRAPVDLYLAGGATLAAVLIVALDGPGFLRIPLALLMVLVLPGYAVMAVAFPEATRLHLFRRVTRGLPAPEPPPARALAGLDRIALAMVTSVALTGFAGLALAAMPVGITVASLLSVLAGVTLLASLIGLYLRFTVEETKRPRFLVPIPEFHAPTGTDILMQVLLVASGLVLGTVLLLEPPKDPSPESFTGFYLLGPPGASDCFPERYQDGAFHSPYVEPVCPSPLTNVTIGVVNHETGLRNYTLYIEWQDELAPGAQGAAPSYPVDLWSFDLERASAPGDGRLEIERQYEVVYDLPEPRFEGAQQLVFKLYIGHQATIDRDNPDESLVLHIEHLPDATPP